MCKGPEAANILHSKNHQKANVPWDGAWHPVRKVSRSSQSLCLLSSEPSFLRKTLCFSLSPAGVWEQRPPHSVTIINLGVVFGTISTYLCGQKCFFHMPASVNSYSPKEEKKKMAQPTNCFHLSQGTATKAMQGGGTVCAHSWPAGRPTHQQGPSPMWQWCPNERRGHRPIWGTTLWRHRQRTAVYKPRRGTSEETSPALILAF